MDSQQAQALQQLEVLVLEVLQEIAWHNAQGHKDILQSVKLLRRYNTAAWALLMVKESRLYGPVSQCKDMETMTVMVAMNYAISVTVNPGLATQFGSTVSADIESIASLLLAVLQGGDDAPSV